MFLTTSARVAFVSALVVARGVAQETIRVSVDASGAEGNYTSYDAAISSDGFLVAFTSYATNLVPGDTNNTLDVFLRDRVAGTTERVSVGPGGVEGNEASGALSTNAISANGRFVVFGSIASNLVPGDTNGPAYDLFVRDRVAGTTERVTVTSGGAQLLADSSQPAISGDGRYVAFFSLATNVVPNDTNGVRDVFVRDRLVGGETTSFTSVCEPGAGSVAPCPCGNAAGSPGRGCDNSAATGGAALAASGDTELSADGLVFTTSGEMPSALSVLAQGSAFVTNGAVYGQGVRCVGGALKRLFTKSASGGSIVAPDFAAGDPPVSVRSAAKGDSIQPGQTRWYLVYYRDPNVLGGCAATRTFNSTQTQQIAWVP
jgi:hypothetical protein